MTRVMSAATTTLVGLVACSVAAEVVANCILADVILVVTQDVILVVTQDVIPVVDADEVAACSHKYLAVDVTKQMTAAVAPKPQLILVVADRRILAMLDAPVACSPVDYSRDFAIADAIHAMLLKLVLHRHRLPALSQQQLAVATTHPTADAAIRVAGVKKSVFWIGFEASADTVATTAVALPFQTRDAATAAITAVAERAHQECHRHRQWNRRKLHPYQIQMD